MSKEGNGWGLWRLLNVAGLIVDGYKGIGYNGKNKEVVYLWLGVRGVGRMIDFYICIKCGCKVGKLSGLGWFAMNGVGLLRSFKKVRDEYEYE